MSNAVDRKRLIELVGLLSDELISDEQLAELDAMLIRSAEARELYRNCLGLHRDLEERLVEIPSGIAEENTQAAIVVARSSHAFASWTIAATLVVGLVSVVLMLRHEDGVTSNPVAIVGEMVDVVWAEGQTPLSTLETLRPGRVRLASGIVCLQYRNGVVMALEGPADLDMLSRDHVALQQGQIVTYVPETVEGFAVSTPTAKFSDRAIEYGLVVKPDGNAELCVFDGEVSIRSARGEQKAAKRGGSGLAYQINAAGVSKSVGYRPSSFEDGRSIVRKGQIIRDPFRALDRLTENPDRSFGQPRYYLGDTQEKRHKSWVNFWAIDIRNASINERTSGIVTDENLVETTELVPGSTRYLLLEALAHPEQPEASLSMSRSFESVKDFEIDRPYTVEFLARLDSDPSEIREVRVRGLPGLDRNMPTSIWRMRTRQIDGRPVWQMGSGATMPLVRGRTYRFLIEVDPVAGWWRGSISDGQSVVYSDQIGWIADSTNLASQQSTLRLDIDFAPASNLRLSFDAVRIQNRSPATTLTVF